MYSACYSGLEVKCLNKIFFYFITAKRSEFGYFLDLPRDSGGRDVSRVATHAVGRASATVPQHAMSISSSTQRYYRKKAEEAVDTVLDATAPGNSSWLLKQVFTKHQIGRSASAASEEDSLVSRLVTLYNEPSSWYTQQQILSLFAGDYTKTELLKLVPGLTKFRIDEARRHAFQTKPGEIIEPPTITRSRLDPAKVDHFLDFISTLKLSNGEKINIPNVVRTVISSRLIQLYQTYCLESCFKPLGRSTLFNILKVWMETRPSPIL